MSAALDRSPLNRLAGFERLESGWWSLLSAAEAEGVDFHEEVTQ
jgi:hypothetical protein